MPKDNNERDNSGYIELFSPMDIIMAKRCDSLVKHAQPLNIADVLMRNLANKISDMAIAPKRGETSDEAVMRFKITCGYIEVLKYLADQMETEIMPSLKRLYVAQYPEEAKEQTE